MRKDNLILEFVVCTLFQKQGCDLHYIPKRVVINSILCAICNVGYNLKFCYTRSWPKVSSWPDATTCSEQFDFYFTRSVGWS